MSSVERSTLNDSLSTSRCSNQQIVLQYSRGDVIDQEAPHEIPDSKPAPEWPAKGAIEFKDVTMRYRPGLPLVLKSLSMQVKGGEKIGVVGRYAQPFSC